MRPLRRLTTMTPLRGFCLIAAASCFAQACTLPDVTIRKETQTSSTSSTAPFATTSDASGHDKRYLATVQIRFSENKDASPLVFDIQRDRQNLIAARLLQTEQTSTTLHLGYTSSDGAIAGLHFGWHF